MSRSVEITLALPLVLPMVDRLRAQAAMHDTHDVHSLVNLFDEDFPKTGRITISDELGPAILRACSFLRLQLRQGALAALPDATLESKDLDLKLHAGEEHAALSYYVFLAVLQEALLKNDIGPPPGRPARAGVFASWTGLFQHYFRANSPSPQPLPRDSWQVVVLNDPVNLMAYVVAVLRAELGKSEADAKQHMMNVHELKRSTVWTGPRGEAEARVRDLRAWHLNAVLQSPNG